MALRRALAFAATASAMVYSAAAGRQKLIVDTDMGFDVDDVVAVCLANALHMAGEAELLAVVHDTGCELGIGGVSAMNHFYGHDNVTLGAWKGKYGSNCNQHYEGTSGQNQYLSKVRAALCELPTGGAQPPPLVCARFEAVAQAGGRRLRVWAWTPRASGSETSAGRGVLTAGSYAMCVPVTPIAPRPPQTAIAIAIIIMTSPSR